MHENEWNLQHLIENLFENRVQIRACLIYAPMALYETLRYLCIHVLPNSLHVSQVIPSMTVPGKVNKSQATTVHVY